MLVFVLVEPQGCSGMFPCCLCSTVWSRKNHMKRADEGHHCAFVTFDDHRHTRLQNNNNYNKKTSCALPPSDLDSPPAENLMSPSHSSHYRFGVMHVC